MVLSGSSSHVLWHSERQRTLSNNWVTTIKNACTLVDAPNKVLVNEWEPHKSLLNKVDGKWVQKGGGVSGLLKSSTKMIYWKWLWFQSPAISLRERNYNYLRWFQSPQGLFVILSVSVCSVLSSLPQYCLPVHWQLESLCLYSQMCQKGGYSH